MEGDIYREITRLRDKGMDAALVTVISANGSTPQRAGAKMLVRPDGSILSTIGGGNLEAEIIKESIAIIKSGKPQRFYYDLSKGGNVGMVCGGNLEVFIESVSPMPALFIFGGGHISLFLTKMANLVGFKILIIDPHESVNTKMLPDTGLTLAIDFTAAFSSSKVKINESSYVVVATRDHKSDEAVLEKALNTNARYIGLIGSKTKREAIFSNLLAKGITQDSLNKVHNPIGLAINAQTPAEIAISILAEMIQVRRSTQADT
jgi:xanthine dehydrogenase accessory factor